MRKAFSACPVVGFHVPQRKGAACAVLSFSTAPCFTASLLEGAQPSPSSHKLGPSGCPCNPPAQASGCSGCHIRGQPGQSPPERGEQAVSLGWFPPQGSWTLLQPSHLHNRALQDPTWLAWEGFVLAPSSHIFMGQVNWRGAGKCQAVACLQQLLQASHCSWSHRALFVFTWGWNQRPKGTSCPIWLKILPKPRYWQPGVSRTWKC